MFAAHGSQPLTEPDAVSNPEFIHRPARRGYGLRVTVALLSLTGLLWLAPAGIALLLQPVYGAPAHHPLHQAQPTTPALVSAASGVVPLGGISVTLAVSVSNVVDLGAVTAEVRYDNAVLAPVHCRLNRTAFSLGLCNLAFDSNGDGRPDAVRFNPATLSGVSAPASAPVIMVEISWIATGTATVGMTTPLSVTVSNFANSGGEASLPFTTQNGQVVIGSPPPTATPLPTAVQTATPANTPIPTPLSTPAMTPTVVSPTPTGVRDAAIFLPVVASP